AHRAYAAACDAELVAAAQAGEQIPAPLEREVRARHERTVRLVALAEAVTEIDVALQPRCLRGTDRQQSVRDQQVHKDAGFERAKRRLDQRRDLGRRAAPAPSNGRVRVLEVGRIELANTVIAQARPETNRARARLVPDHADGELELRFFAAVAVVGRPHICLSPLYSQIRQLRLTLPLMVF